VTRTGLSRLDAALPVLEPGHLWAVVGPRGIGVSELCLCLARHAGTECRAARVIISNAHLSTGLVGTRLGPTPSAEVILLEDLPLPEPGRGPAWATPAGVSSADLVVYDTLDEGWGDGHPPCRGDALALMRGLRQAARRQHTAVIVTFRVAPTDPDRAGVTSAWRRHPWHEAATDAGDVVITLADAGTWPHVHAVVDSRLSRQASCQIRQDPKTGRFVEERHP
jgi:hypothetical protein